GELTRVGVELPGALDSGVELGGQRAGLRGRVVGDVRQRHVVSLLGWAGRSKVQSEGPAASRSSMRATRSRQISSSWSRASWAARSDAGMLATRCSRPWRCLVTNPALSRTATCFCTAAKLIGYSLASAVTGNC